MSYPATRLTVLVADDDPQARETARRVLERAGCRVLLAEDGAEALETISRGVGEIDVAILGLVMPRLSGLTALRRLRVLDPSVSIVLTCRGTQGVGAALLRRRADAVARKPFAAGDLLHAVRSAVRAAHSFGVA
jgi:DNA-binding response OmpR family regulator